MTTPGRGDPPKLTAPETEYPDPAKAPTVIERTASTCCGGYAESLTRTVNGNVPAATGGPADRAVPAEGEPSGKLPLIRLQSYEGVPPEASSEAL